MKKLKYISIPEKITKYENNGFIKRIIHIPPKVIIIEKKGSTIKIVFNIPVIILLKKNIAPNIKKMNVIEII